MRGRESDRERERVREGGGGRGRERGRERKRGPVCIFAVRSRQVRVFHRGNGSKWTREAGRGLDGKKGAGHACESDGETEKERVRKGGEGGREREREKESDGRDHRNEGAKRTHIAFSNKRAAQKNTH